MTLRPTLVAAIPLLFVASACAGGAGAKSGSASGPHPLLDKPAPAVEGTVVPGSPTATLKHPGEIVIVDFWATYCGPCVKEFPRLQGLVDKYAGKVHVVAVSEDEDPELVPPFVKRTGVKFPITWDKGKAIGELYSVDSMPQTFVLDGKGVIRFVHHGYRAGEAEELDAQIKQLLAE